MDKEFLPFDRIVDSIIDGFSLDSILGAQAYGGHLLRLLGWFQDEPFSVTGNLPRKRVDILEKQLKVA